MRIADRWPFLIYGNGFTDTLMPYRKITGIGNETEMMGFVVKLIHFFHHPLLPHLYMRMQDHFFKSSVSIFGFQHNGFCRVSIFLNDDAGFGTKMKKPEHMTG